MMETVFKDIRYATRSLLKHPGFTVIAVITLALGIGANTAMFSVINAVLLRPLPYHEPQQLVTIWEQSPERDLYEMPVSFASIPLLKGRDFSDRDKSDAPAAAIINAELARVYFPNEDPINKRITFDDRQSFISIVGIVGDVKQLGLDSNAKPEVYFSYLQAASPSMSIVVRTSSNPMGAVAFVKSQIQTIDKNLPIDDAETMQQLLSESTSGRRFNTLLLSLFAMLAVVLAMVGIYGVMSYSVTQRTHEIGIRIAVGAQTSDVFRIVIGQGMLLALIGVGLGLVGAFALTRLMTTMLFGVEPTDPLTFISLAALLVGVGLVACYVPGRRATRIDPLVALRYE